MLLPLMVACEEPSPDAQLYAATLEAPSPPAARDQVLRISDPLIRDAAVIDWVAAHRGDISLQDAQGLCGLANPDRVDDCVRRFSAAHLSR